MRRALCSLVVTACAFSGGCSYFQNRVNDLLDPFRFDVGVGPGLYAEARATDFLALALGGQVQNTVGMNGRFVRERETFAYGFSWVVMGGATTKDASPILADDPSRYVHTHDSIPNHIVVVPGFGSFHHPEPWTLANRGVHVADLGVSLVLVEVGASIGFSPGEVVDFLLGIVGLDIAGDDSFGREPEATGPVTSGTPAPASPRSPR